MRWYILKALLQKEFARHLANRGGITLALLLVAGATLLSVFSEKGATGTGMVGGVNNCYVVYDPADEGHPLVAHLKANRPPALKNQIHIKSQNPKQIETLLAQNPGTATIQVGFVRTPGRPEVLEVFVWHPKDDPEAMAAYEAWFWKETRRGLAAEARKAAPNLPPDPDFDADLSWSLLDSHAHLKAQAAAAGAPGAVPDLEVRRKGLAPPPLTNNAAIATGLVVFALYFACVYLLPTLNCEERERGALLAQALSPASPTELLAAKFLFYPTFGLGLAATLAGIVQPDVLSKWFFWLSLVAVAGGFMGIGMTIAAFARTQRAAFLGGMCYLLSVSMVLLICSVNHIPFIPYLAVEYHGPRILHAAMSGTEQNHHWFNLLAAMVLAVAWLGAAGWVFRRRGWQ